HNRIQNTTTLYTRARLIHLRLRLSYVFCPRPGDHRDLHSFPTRRSSDLKAPGRSRTFPCSTTTACAPGSASSTGCSAAASCRDRDRKSTRLNSSHQIISYAVFCLKKKSEHEQSIGLSF